MLRGRQLALGFTLRSNSDSVTAELECSLNVSEDTQQSIREVYKQDGLDIVKGLDEIARHD